MTQPNVGQVVAHAMRFRNLQLITAEPELALEVPPEALDVAVVEDYACMVRTAVHRNCRAELAQLDRLQCFDFAGKHADTT